MAVIRLNITCYRRVILRSKIDLPISVTARVHELTVPYYLVRALCNVLLKTGYNSYYTILILFKFQYNVEYFMLQNSDKFLRMLINISIYKIFLRLEIKRH